MKSWPKPITTFNQSNALETGLTRTSSPNYQASSGIFKISSMFETEDAPEAYDQIVFGRKDVKSTAPQFQYYHRETRWHDQSTCTSSKRCIHPKTPRQQKNPGVDNKIQYLKINILS